MMTDDEKYKVKRRKSFFHGPSKENYNKGKGTNDMEHSVIDKYEDKKMFGVRLSRRKADF